MVESSRRIMVVVVQEIGHWLFFSARDLTHTSSHKRLTTRSLTSEEIRYIDCTRVQGSSQIVRAYCPMKVDLSLLRDAIMIITSVFFSWNDRVWQHLPGVEQPLRIMQKWRKPEPQSKYFSSDWCMEDESSSLDVLTLFIHRVCVSLFLLPRMPDGCTQAFLKTK